MSDRIAQFALFFPVFLFSLSLHEFSHAWVANRLGDGTARMAGRMTLNPLAHIDWVGTFLFPLLMFLMPGLLLFGWARPVPVNPFNLKGGRRDHLKVAAAGPLSNVGFAFFLAIVYRMLPEAPDLTVSIMAKMVETGLFLNLMLAFFNLIPLHPLDGGKVFEGILPTRYLPRWDQINRYGFLILIAALYLGILRYLAIPVFFLARLLLP